MPQNQNAVFIIIHLMKSIIYIRKGLHNYDCCVAFSNLVLYDTLHDKGILKKN